MLRVAHLAKGWRFIVGFKSWAIFRGHAFNLLMNAGFTYSNSLPTFVI